MIVQNFILCAVLVCARGIEIEIGNMIDLFRNYGHLARIFPIDEDHDEFMQIEFSENIFDKRASKNIISINDRLPRNENWQVDTHENIGSVLRSVLKDYKIDFVEYVEKAFVSSYSRKNIAGFFRTNHLHLSDQYSYILMTYKKTVAHLELMNSAIKNSTLDPKILNAIENITLGDTQAVLRFVSKFGSHYVHSFSNGELLYQIFAIPQTRYTCLVQLKQIFTFDDILKCVNESEIRPSDIKTLTNNVDLEMKLNFHSRNKHKFPNLFLVKEDSNFMLKLDKFQDSVITSFNLRNVADAVSEPKSTFIREVISNHVTLRELFLHLS